MSLHIISSATDAVRNSNGAIAHFADRVGMIALLIMGVAMGGVTAFSGL